MEKKYKIVLSEKYVHKSENGNEWFQFPVNVSGQLVAIQTVIPLEPYTEPDMEQVRKEAYKKGFEDGKHFCPVPEVCHDNAYQKGLSDAWECARKIADIPYGEEEKVFGSDGWTFIANHTAQEAIEEIRQYEQEKDRQARIEYNFDEIKDVIETTAKEYNMSFDEIAEVFKKMGEH